MRLWWAVLEAELRQQLRDGNTLLFSVLVPCFLFPGLLWGYSQAAALAEGWAESARPTVAVPADLAAELPDTLVRVEPGAPADAEVVHDGAALVVRYAGGDPLADLAADRLMDALDHPWPVESVDIAPPKEALVGAVAGAIPMLLVVLSAMASQYPALEAMVADRERNVVETVLVTAAPRSVFVLGKLASVAIITLMSMGATLVGTVVTLLHLALMSERTLGLPPARLVLLVPFAALAALAAAAFSLVAAAPVRSFKQGQNTMSLATLVPMSLAMAALAPGASLAAPWGLVPITNAVLCMRELLLDKPLGVWGWVAAGELVALVLVAGGIAARSLSRRMP